MNHNWYDERNRVDEPNNRRNYMVSVLDLMKARAKATLQTQVLNWDLWHSNGACQQHFPFLPFSIHDIRNYYNVFVTFF